MISGICRVCGCTEQRACSFDVDGDAFQCGWMDRAQTLCSNPRCIAITPLADLVEIYFAPKAAAAASR